MKKKISLAILTFHVGAALATPTTTRESLTSGGGELNADSYAADITPDGGFTAWSSNATNAVTSDTNGAMDAFVRNNVNGRVEIISQSTAGVYGNNISVAGGMSSDGRYVVFESWADNLIPSDSNINVDVFVRDRLMQTTERVSINPVSGANGGYLGAISGDGRYVVFCSGSIGGVPNAHQVYRYDRDFDVLDHVSVSPLGAPGNSSLSCAPSISEDGNLVAFHSDSSNLVSGDTNGTTDIFLRDMASGTTIRISSIGGIQGNGTSASPQISDDGSVVVFYTYASNLSPADTNGVPDVYLHNVGAGTLTLVSTNGSVAANGESHSPAVDPFGEYVTFMSTATNLGPTDTNGAQDVYMVSMLTSSVTLVSMRSSGAQISSHAYAPAAVSADGEYILFSSADGLIVAGDTNGIEDVFRRGPY